LSGQAAPAGRPDGRGRARDPPLPRRGRWRALGRWRGERAGQGAASSAPTPGWWPAAAGGDETRPYETTSRA